METVRLFSRNITISRFEKNLKIFLNFYNCKYKITKKALVYGAPYGGRKIENMIEVEIQSSCIEKLKSAGWHDVYIEVRK